MLVYDVQSPVYNVVPGVALAPWGCCVLQHPHISHCSQTSIRNTSQSRKRRARAREDVRALVGGGEENIYGTARRGRVFIGERGEEIAAFPPTRRTQDTAPQASDTPAAAAAWKTHTLSEVDEWLARSGDGWTVRDRERDTLGGE